MLTKISIDRKNRIPLYIQIKEKIKGEIKKGELKTERLPTERELADILGISRNTVSMAYRELENEGLIDTQIGRGTFIISSSELSDNNREMVLLKSIEHSVEEAMTLGFTLEEYQSIADNYIDKKQEMLKKIKIVFIECNQEQLIYFSGHLKLDPSISIIPILLSDLRKAPSKKAVEIEMADMVVTSFYHLEEVKKILSPFKKEVMGISLTPEMSTIIQIARIPPSCSVGIITTSREFLKEIQNTLKKMDIQFHALLSTTSHRQEDIHEVITKSQAAIVSPSRKKEVESIAKGEKKAVEFLYAPDQASINNLKIALLDIKEKL